MWEDLSYLLRSGPFVDHERQKSGFPSRPTGPHFVSLRWVDGVSEPSALECPCGESEDLPDSGVAVIITPRKSILF